MKLELNKKWAQSGIYVKSKNVDSRCSRTAISAHLEALNSDFYEFLHFLKTELTAPKMAKTALLAILDSPKLNSRKIWVTKNSWNFHTVKTETIQIEKWRDKNSVKISWKFCQMYFGHYNQKNKFCAKNSRVTMQKLRRLQIWISWSLTVLEKVVEIFWFLMIFVIKFFLSC